MALVCAVLVGGGCAGNHPQDRAAGQHPRHRHDQSDQHREPRHQHRAHSAHHRFEDPAVWAPVFESKERDAWQRPDRVIAALGLRPEQHIADIGAATGYFAVRFARALPRGKVWGVDIEPRMVAYLDQRAAREGLTPRLSGVLGTADDPRIPEPVDLIFICNTYHHIERRPEYFRRLADRLRPGGRIVVVDFKAGEIPVGPPEAQRVPPPQLRRELESAGYREVALDTTTLPHQYIASYARR